MPWREPGARTVGDVEEDPRTIPTVECDGDPGCEGPVAVLFLGTGARMCPHCAADKLHAMIAEPAFRDTDRPAADPDPEVEVSGG